MGILNKLFGAINTIAEQAKTAMQQSADGADCGDKGYWDSIPSSPNQYNSGLDYREYFELIFRESFPEYDLAFEEAAHRPATIATFTKGGRKSLVVELMSEKTSAKMLRWRCENEGVPYLRFYYDHWGWWNEKSYVIERVSRALGA